MKTFGRMILGLVVVGMIAGCRPSRSRQQTPAGEEVRKAVVQVTLVDSGEVVRRVTFTGTVAGEVQAPILPEVPGKVLTFRVKEGEHVAKGDTLALVDRSLPGMAYEPFPVLAPLTGRVHWEVFTPGEPVGPQRPMGTIVGTSLEVRFRVPGRARVRVGDPLQVLVPGDTLAGRVTWVSSVVDPRTQTLLVRGTLNGTLALRPGEVVKVRTIVARERGVRVPRQALLYAPTPFVVQVVEGKAHRQAVDLVLLGDRYALLRNGLAVGDTVIVVGQRVVEEGQPVQVEAAP